MFTHRSINFLIVLAFLVAACTPEAEPPTMTSIPTLTPMPAPTYTPMLTPTPWSLVVVGDSIPFNSSQDCPGCKGFVDWYAEAITAATGHAVKVQNLFQHNSLQIDGLLQEMKTDTFRRDALAKADIIIVGIAHNDAAMNSNDDLCDGPNGDNPDWSKYNATCAAASVSYSDRSLRAYTRRLLLSELENRPSSAR